MFLAEQDRPLVKQNKTALLLDEVSDLLKARWVNGNPVIYGGVCLGSAIAWLAFDHGVEHHVIHSAVLNAITMKTGKRYRYIPEYNDDSERTLEDVLDVVRIAREIA